MANTENEVNRRVPMMCNCGSGVAIFDCGKDDRSKRIHDAWMNEAAPIDLETGKRIQE